MTDAEELAPSDQVAAAVREMIAHFDDYTSDDAPDMIEVKSSEVFMLLLKVCGSIANITALQQNQIDALREENSNLYRVISRLIAPMREHGILDGKHLDTLRDVINPTWSVEEFLKGQDDSGT